MAEPVTARQNAIYDCTHIYLDAFGKKGRSEICAAKWLQSILNGLQKQKIILCIR